MGENTNTKIIVYLLFTFSAYGYEYHIAWILHIPTQLEKKIPTQLEKKM